MLEEVDAEEGVDRIPDESRTRRLAPAGRERHGDPVVDGGERCRRVQVIRQVLADVPQHRRRPADRRRPSRHGASAAGAPTPPEAGTVTSPCRSGSGPPAAQAAPPRPARRRREGPRRTRGCPWTSTSSRRPGRACRRGRTNVRTASSPSRHGPPRPTSRGAGTPGPSRRPGRRRPLPRCSSAIAAHSTCHPGRPRPVGPSQAGSPGRSRCQSRQSSGSFLPGRSGSPPRSANSSIIVARSSPDTSPKRGSACTGKYRSLSTS